MNHDAAPMLWNSAASEPVTTADIRFEFVEASDAFRAIETEWRDLCARTTGHGYFQRFAWQWRVWQHVASARGRRLCILVGRSEGRIVLLWPLMRDGRQIRLLASDKVEYRDLIVEDGPHAKAWMAGAWDTVRSMKNIDVLLFQDVRSGSNLDQLLRSHCTKGWKHDRRSHVIRLDRFDGWDDYAKTLSKKMISDQRRQWRRIAADGAQVRFEILNSKEDVQEGLDWMLHHKLAWLRASGINDDTFGSPEYTDFIHDVVQNAFDAKYLFFSRLRVGEITVAAGLGYKCGSEFTFHMFTYDAAWQSYSPGRLLQERIIRWCFDNGVALFDFMPGEEGYKAIWANDEFWVTDYLVPLTLRGAAIIRWHASGLSTLAEKDWLKHVYRCLPRGVRRRLNAALLAHREYAGQMKRL